MQEIKSGSIVAFSRNNVVKQGTVLKVYEDFDIVIVNVPEDNAVYKVAVTDVTVMSEPKDQETTEPDEVITVTLSEFNSITQNLINSLSDNDVKLALTLFSDLLSDKLFGTLKTDV